MTAPLLMNLYYIDLYYICAYNIFVSSPPGMGYAMRTVALELADMKKGADEACRLMKVLANPDRLLILCQLTHGEKRVGELEEHLGIVQPTLSQQLTVLRDEELVRSRREGKNIYYQLSSPKALAVMKALYDQFCRKSRG
jgi:DNA-binding transcriptional ArsR family regulator